MTLVTTGARRRPAAAWMRRYQALALSTDLTVACVASAVAFLARFQTPAQSHANLWMALLFPVAWVLGLYLAKAYETRYLFVGTDEYARVLLNGVALTAAISFFSYATKAEVARGYVLAVLPLATVITVLSRHLVRSRLHHQRERGMHMRRVVLVGYERSIANMCRQLGRERYHGMDVVGACLPPHRPYRDMIEDVGVPVQGTFESVPEAVELCEADAVAVLACPEMDAEMLRRLAWRLEVTDTDLLVAPALMDVAGFRTTIRPVDGLPLLHVDHPQFTGARRIFKRAFDITASAFLIAMLSPVLLAIAVAVRLDDSGPSLFRQERVGRSGRRFVMFKFRTMHTNAEERLAELLAMNEHDGVMFKIKDDPRITRVGSFLRRYSLDELPQLFNVFRGEMSLVGPRPPLPREVELYEDDVTRRFVIKPGLTGLWQVSGRSDLSWEESVRLDLRYVENWSIAFDLAILWRTARAVITSSGAY